MEKELAENYAQYLKTDLGKEIGPISTNIEEMLTRLEEFESLLNSVRVDSHTIIQKNIPQTLAFQKDFDQLCNRIDSLDKFVNVVDDNLKVLEQSVEVAEEELGINNYSLQGLLKPLFSKSKSSNKPSTNLENGEFKSPTVFKTEDYFTIENTTTTT